MTFAGDFPDVLTLKEYTCHIPAEEYTVDNLPIAKRVDQGTSQSQSGKLPIAKPVSGQKPPEPKKDEIQEGIDFINGLLARMDPKWGSAAQQQTPPPQNGQQAQPTPPPIVNSRFPYYNSDLNENINDQWEEDLVAQVLRMKWEQLKELSDEVNMKRALNPAYSRTREYTLRCKAGIWRSHELKKQGKHGPAPDLLEAACYFMGGWVLADAFWGWKD